VESFYQQDWPAALKYLSTAVQNVEFISLDIHFDKDPAIDSARRGDQHCIAL
jgi:hypothetical protein